jgi:hypothetical protein
MRGSASAKMTLVAQGEGAPEDEDMWPSTWVAKEGRIPGLLATVALDAYDRWKAAGKQGGIDAGPE